MEALTEAVRRASWDNDVVKLSTGVVEIIIGELTDGEQEPEAEG